MADPALNPVAYPHLNGRRVLHVRKTTDVQRLRTDHESEAALNWLKATLAGDRVEDRPSISLVVRRALKLYRGHVSSLLGTPQGLDRERRAVRQDSRLPRLRKTLLTSPKVDGAGR
jgi:hypothetical protein